MKQTLLISALLGLGVSALHAQSSNVDSLRTQLLDEVAVVATRAGERTPMAHTNLGKADIAKQNLGLDLPYLLQLQPSVVATSDAGTGVGYTSLRVRGVDPTGVNITLGGVPINDSESQAVFWVNMPDLASSLGSIQVQRGVGTSSNGAGAFGATINMSTDKLSYVPYAEVGVSGGSFGTLRRNIRLGSGRLGGRWAVEGRLSQITSKGYVDRSGVDLWSYFLQAGYFGERTTIKYLTFGGKEVTGIAWNGLSSDDEKQYGRTYNSAGYMGFDLDGVRQYYRNTDNYTQTHHHLSLSHQFSPSLVLNVTGHYTAGFGYTDEFRTGRKLVEYGLKTYTIPDPSNPSSMIKVKKTSLIRRKYLDNDFYGMVSSLAYTTDKWRVHLGVSANNYVGDHYGEIRWIKDYPISVYPESRYYEGVGHKLDIAPYLKASYQVNEALTLFGDVQYRHVGYRITGTTDNYDEINERLQQMNLLKSFNFVNPKAGVHYRFNAEHEAYASVAVAHREPNRKVFTEASANRIPQAERLTDYELGYSWRTRVASVGLSGYYMSYRDQLVTNGKLNDVGAMELENVADSYRMGLELQTSIRPLNWLSFDASVALSRSRIKEYDYYYSVYDDTWDWTGLSKQTYKDVAIGFSPSVVASGALRLAHSGFEAALTAQAVSSQYLDNTQNAERKLPAYQVFGLNLGYDLPIGRWAKRWQINLQINNLLNSQYSSTGYVYDAGITSQGDQYSDIRLFPQAGINFLLGTTLSF